MIVPTAISVFVTIACCEPGWVEDALPNVREGSYVISVQTGGSTEADELDNHAVLLTESNDLETCLVRDTVGSPRAWTISA